MTLREIATKAAALATLAGHTDCWVPGAVGCFEAGDYLNLTIVPGEEGLGLRDLCSRVVGSLDKTLTVGLGTSGVAVVGFSVDVGQLTFTLET
jgi:hypothetical protein